MFMLIWCWKNEETAPPHPTGSVCGNNESVWTVYYNLRQTGNYDFRLLDMAGIEMKPGKSCDWFFG